MPKKKVISYNALVDKVLALCPNAEFGEDSSGQITIETGFAMKGSDEDEPLEPLSEIDEESEYEEDDEEEDEDSEEEDDEDND